MATEDSIKPRQQVRRNARCCQCRQVLLTLSFGCVLLLACRSALIPEAATLDNLVRFRQTGSAHGLGASCSFFVSSKGSDSSNGSLHFPFRTLARAQRAVQGVVRSASNTTVNIAPGLYTLSSPLELSLQDSPAHGSGARVTWRAWQEPAASRRPSVIISGGTLIRFERAEAETGDWVASVQRLSHAVRQARQLYVNGVRATRTVVRSGGCARSNVSMCAKPRAVWGESHWQAHTDPKARASSPGYLITGSQQALEALSWPNGGRGVEFVFTGVGGSPWSESRCPVVGITPWSGRPNGSALVTMAQPCFRCFQHKCLVQKRKGRVPPPTTIENVGRDYLQPGQYWVDVPGALLYYRPRSGEQLASSHAVLPTLETLLRGRGGGAGRGPPIAHLRFEGLSFRHATWRGPSGGAGYVEDQSGVGVACVQGEKDVVAMEAARRRGAGCPACTPTPAHVAFHHATDVAFIGCDFTRLGANALLFNGGAHNNAAIGCRFADISAAAFQVGGFDTASAASEAEMDLGNTMQDCTVVRPALDFRGSVGVLVGYAARTVISRNEIMNCTYGAISVGWGWGRASYAHDNLISHNAVHSYKRLLNDGGCIYTLSPQPGTTIRRNWCNGQGTATSALCTLTRAAPG